MSRYITLSGRAAFELEVDLPKLPKLEGRGLTAGLLMLALRLEENPRDIELDEPLPAAAQPLQTSKALQSPTCTINFHRISFLHSCIKKK